MRRCVRRWVTIVGVALTLSLVLAAAALAVGNGAQNGEDIDCCGWIGTDSPGAQGSYSYINPTHDLILSEWIEPGHDWLRNRDMFWTQQAENKLDAETDSKTLTYELRIHDQFYYNFSNAFNTNLPWSKAPEGENAIEELAQGYTEVDMEQVDPWRININTNYFWDQRFDSEKASINGLPDIWSEVEYCNKQFNSCNFDETGWLNKKVNQQ